MDIVIPLAKSRIDHLDLRYVLRSLEAFTAHGDIYLIGEKPKWVNNVHHVPFSDNPKKEWKERNIFLKTQEAFKYTDTFFFMNDDHVLLAPIILENYPNYYKGTCYESMLKNSTHYRATMNQTRKWLEAHGYEDLNFDGHCPVIMEKEHFKQVSSYDWDVKFGYGMKSLYCAGLEGTFMPDAKIHQHVSFDQAAAKCTGRHVISFTDAAIKSGMRQYLDTILPHKSKYER